MCIHNDAGSHWTNIVKNVWWKNKGHKMILLKKNGQIMVIQNFTISMFFLFFLPFSFSSQWLKKKQKLMSTSKQYFSTCWLIEIHNITLVSVLQLPAFATMTWPPAWAPRALQVPQLSWIAVTSKEIIYLKLDLSILTLQSILPDHCLRFKDNFWFKLVVFFIQIL